jgi:hypothetical protein
METNKIITGGGIMPSTIDTPGDVRTRVQTFADISSIDNPFVGMEVWVIDEAKEYRIKKLVPKTIGGVEIPNGAIDINDPDAVVDTKKEFIAEAVAEAETALGSKAKVEGDTLYL